MCVCEVPCAAMQDWLKVSWQAGFGAPEAGWRHHSGGELVELHLRGCCWGAVQSKVMLDRWLDACLSASCWVSITRVLKNTLGYGAPWL